MSVFESWPGLLSDDWAWSTIMQFGHTVESPGPNGMVEGVFRRIIGGFNLEDNCFALPVGMLWTDGVSKLFFERAYQAQQRWMRDTRKILGNTGARFEMRKASPIIRQLSFSGVMIIQGRHRFPGKW